MGMYFECFMSQITHVHEMTDTEKTTISIVYYERIKNTCILRVCKNRNLSELCKLLQKVKNPNVVFIYDFVYENGNTYILEENISGDTLEMCIGRKGVFSEKETAEIILEVCKGLSDFHSMNPPIVHNDINTSNIMICDDNKVKLFDFDISRVYKKGNSQNTELFGTEEYASPEHFGYGQSEPSTDIYCLGVTMHKMLTGKTLSQEHKSCYKGKLKKIIDKCTKVDVKKRYGSAKKLQKQLEKFLNRRKRCLVVFLYFLVIVLLIGGTVNVLYRQYEKLMNELLGNAFYVSSVEYGTDTSDSPNDDSDKDTEHNAAEEIINTQTTDVIEVDNEVSSEDVYLDTEIDEHEMEYDLSENDSVISVPGDDVDENRVNNTDEYVEKNNITGFAGQKDESKDITNIEEVQKTANVVRYLDGELMSLLTMKDDVIVYLEKMKDGYYINTSSSSQAYLLDVNLNGDCKLAYDYYKEKLYLISYANNETKINLFNEDFGLVEEPVYTGIGSSLSDKNYFFSDGILFSSSFYDSLVDCNSWKSFGDLGFSDVSAILNDRIFSQPSYSSICTIKEFDFTQNTINTYGLPFNGYHCVFYSDNKNIYFIAKQQREDLESLYCFNGRETEEIMCLNDYKYYTGLLYDRFCVTDKLVWAYDKTTNSIREFKLD